MNRALFLDRDGIVNRRIVGGYVRTPDEFELLDDVIPLIRAGRRAGMLVILITNQQGVGKELMTDDELDDVHDHMQAMLAVRAGTMLDDIYVCTDLEGSGSLRRKPNPGMLLEAIADHDIDPGESWFVGDSTTDAQAGRGAGVRTLLVGAFPPDAADVVVATLDTAAKKIFADL